MRARWYALHAQLVRSADRLHSHRDYQDFRGRHPGLAGLPDIAALMDHQHDKTGDPQRKDCVLRALVVEAQRPGRQATTAQVLVLLALWPGLDAVHGRLSRHFSSDPDALVSELSGRASEAVRTIDLDRVNRLAATLLLNVRRDIMRGLVRTWSRDDEVITEDIVDPNAPCWRDHVGNLPDAGPDALVIWLRDSIGEDAALVVAVAVLGLSQKEAATGFGLSHDAARKRYQRAIARLREGPDLVAMSQTASGHGVS